MSALLNATDRRVIRLAIPALGSLAVEPLYVFVDTAIVGRVGTAQQAGLGLAAAILAVVFAGSNFLTYGTTERVARRLGAQDRTGAANVSIQTMWLSLFVGIAAALIIGVGSRWWVLLIGADAETAPYANTYLQISALGIPAIVLTLGAQGVLRGGSDFARPMWVLLGTNLLNIAIELVLVIGWEWGIAGSAWSTVIAQWVGAAVFAWLLRHRLSDATQRRPSWAEMTPLMSAAWFLILRVGSMLVILTVGYSIAATRGAVVTAAHTIVSQLFLFAGLVLDALAMPAQALIAEALGGAAGPTPRSIARRVARLSVVGGVLIGLLLAIGAPQLGALFNPDSSVVSVAAAGIYWLAVGVIPGSVAFAYDGVLIGAGDYRFLGLAALFTTVALAPFGAAVALGDGGLGAIWAVLTLWFVIRAGATWARSEFSSVLDVPTHPSSDPAPRSA